MRVAAVALAVAIAGIASGATASARTTVATIYRAFTPHGNSVFKTRLHRGNCFAGAISTGRRDAWRCMAGNVIYDPCFSSSKRPGTVLCPDGPWLATGVKIRLTVRLPAGNRAAPSLLARPWALELYDGRRCRVITGASTVVQGQRANYGCAGNQDGLWGNPDRSTQPWSIFTAPFDAQMLSARAAIRRAWT